MVAFMIFPQGNCDITYIGCNIATSIFEKVNLKFYLILFLIKILQVQDMKFHF